MRKGYAAGKDAFQREVTGNGPAVFIAYLAIILFGSLSFELLSHYTKWSFIERIGACIAAILLAQYFVGRFFNRRGPTN